MKELKFIVNYSSSIVCLLKKQAKLGIILTFGLSLLVYFKRNQTSSIDNVFLKKVIHIIFFYLKGIYRNLLSFIFNFLNACLLKYDSKFFYSLSLENKREPLILLWTKMFNMDYVVHDGSESFYFVNGYAEQLFEKCPLTQRCRVTNNKSLITQSEAVLFNARDLMDISYPVFRSPEQRWIFFNMESPHATETVVLQNLSTNFHFNWTFTYR